MTEMPHPDRPMYDTGAERIVLGSMMLSPSAAEPVIQHVGRVDFYQPAHATIFGALSDLSNNGQPGDPVALAHELDRRGELGRVGGAPYLHTLVAAVPTAANAGHYARIVAEWAKRRRVLESAYVIARAATNLEKDVDEVLDESSRTIHQATTAHQPAESVSLNDIADDEFQHLRDVADGKVAPGISTGFADLDRLLNGWAPGQLIIPAGRPGMGKSVAAACWAVAAAEAGHPVLMFTMEMPTRDVNVRLWSAASRVPLHLFRDPRQLRDEDWARIDKAKQTLRSLPLEINDKANTLPQIQANARRFVQRYGDKHGLIIVDYLQRLSFRDSDRRDLEVGNAAVALKTLATDFGQTVIAVCQLNRGPEQRTNKRPQVSDLRDSGQLEQEADVIVLLHRDDYYDKESARAGEADFIVDKHRNGPTDTITVAAQLHFARFRDMAIG